MTGAVAGATVAGTASTLGVTVLPTAVSGYSDTGATASIVTNAAIATPAGGISPYTYAWAQSGSSPDSWTIGTATAASTSFTAANIAVGNISSAYFTVTVTDAIGSKATATVAATANNGRPYAPQPISTTGTGTVTVGQEKFVNVGYQ